MSQGIHISHSRKLILARKFFFIVIIGPSEDDFYRRIKHTKKSMQYT